MFSCFSKKIENNENNDVRPIYNNIIDSVFTLNKRIENEGYEPNDFDKSYCIRICFQCFFNLLII